MTSPLPCTVLSRQLALRRSQRSHSVPSGRSGRSVSEGGPLLERLGWAPIRSGTGKRHRVAGPSLSVEGRHDTEPLSVRKGSLRMPANNAKTESGGFSAGERAAMKMRTAELRAEGKKGAKKADGLQAVLDSIAKMAPQDRALAPFSARAASSQVSGSQDPQR